VIVVAYRLRLIVLDGIDAPDDARHQGGDPLARFERRKAALARTALSAADYERELSRIADEEGV